MRYLLILMSLVCVSTLAAPSVSAQETYTVRAGDTLYRIATTHNLTVESLKDLNALTDNTIRVGQVLRLAPAPAEIALPDSITLADTTLRVGRVRTHTVTEGETLYSIAAATGTKAYILYAINGDLRAPLEAGQNLLVPADRERRTVYAIGRVDVFPESYAGRAMAGGVEYDPDAFVVSHRDLPLHTVVLLENRQAGTATFAEVADRGPLEARLLMEISDSVADVLQLDTPGQVHVWLVE